MDPEAIARNAAALRRAARDCVDDGSMRATTITRALSMKQPWAWMVVQPSPLWKDIENRREGFSQKSFRGDFYVHATRCTEDYYRDALLWVSERFGYLSLDVPPREKLRTGGIIGKARIVDVLPPSRFGAYPWHMEGQYGFVLEDRKPLPFVSCPGMLGFWRVPDEIASFLEGSTP